MHQLLIPRLDLCTFYFPFPIWLPVSCANRACEGKVDFGGTGRCGFFIAWAFHSLSHKRGHCTWRSHSLATAPSSFSLLESWVSQLNRCSIFLGPFFPSQMWYLSVLWFLLSFGLSVLVLVRLSLSHLNNYFWCKFFSKLTNDIIRTLPTGPQLVQEQKAINQSTSR